MEDISDTRSVYDITYYMEGSSLKCIDWCYG